jgi:hypothetical protein
MGRAATAAAESNNVPAVAGQNGGLPVASQEYLSSFAFFNKEIMEVIRENLGGQEMSSSDFERIKFPTGGGQLWTIPGTDGDPNMVKSIDGIILQYKNMRVFWSEEFNGQGAPPDCQSRDLRFGIGSPGGSCAECVYAKWGSDRKGGKGQACKTIGVLFMIVPGESIPIIVPVPVASVKHLKRFMLRLASQNKKYKHMIVSISLGQDKSEKGIVYSYLNPKVLFELPDEAKGQIDEFIASFSTAMSSAVTAESINDQSGE